MLTRSGPRAGRSVGRRSTSRSSLSLAFALLAGAAGYWGVVAASSTWPPRPTTPRSSRRPGTSTRGRILDRDGKVLASNKKDANGELTGSTPDRRSARSSATPRRVYGRAGLERSYDAELTGSGRRPDQRRVRQVRRRPVRPQGPDPVALVRPPEGRRGGARQATRRGGDARPQTGEILALASTPTYDASAITEPDGRPARSRRSRPTRPSRSCHGRRWGATCPVRCSRS